MQNNIQHHFISIKYLLNVCQDSFHLLNLQNTLSEDLLHFHQELVDYTLFRLNER